MAKLHMAHASTHGAGKLPGPKVTSILIFRSKLSRARNTKRISWHSAGLELTKSHDSALRAKVDGSNGGQLGQCFLFSSQPRVVDTAGPISPAHRGESDSEVSQGVEGDIVICG